MSYAGGRELWWSEDTKFWENICITLIRTFEEVIEERVFLRQDHPKLIELEHEFRELKRLSEAGLLPQHLTCKFKTIRFTHRELKGADLD